MPKLKNLTTDPVKEKEGVWFDCIIPGLEPEKDPTDPEGKRMIVCRFKLAKMNNDAFMAMQTELSEKFKTAFRAGGQFANDAATEVLLQCMAHTIVKAWENVQDDDGSNLECTPENVYAALRKYTAIREWIVQRASEHKPYKLIDDKEALGN